MCSLKAWTLLLSATATSALKLSGNRVSQTAVCNDRLDTFSSEACHQEATGMSKQALSEKARRDWRNVSVGSACSKTYFAYSYDEFEFFWPEFKNCSVSTYGAMVAATVLGNLDMDDPAQCRTRVRADADFIVLPTYLANDCYWPALHEGCSGVTNQLTAGDNCEVRGMKQALAIQSDLGKPVLVIDKAALDNNVYEVLGQTGMIFAKVGTNMTHFREGFDISMPPAAPVTSYQVPPEAFSAPMAAKQYFATFKGNLSTPGGSLVDSIFSNRPDCLVVSEEDDQSAHDDAVFHRSKFVLMTDPESYHFPEAVCGGGVPVMIANAWVPPFDEFVKFDTYGVYMNLRNASEDSALAALGRFSDSELEGMRTKAGEACHGYFQTTELQVRKLLEGVLHRPDTSVNTSHVIDGPHHWDTEGEPFAAQQ